MRRGQRLFWLLGIALLCNASFSAEEEDWQTLVHSRGFCAMYGICGHRKDADVLSCANNTRAVGLPPSGQQKLQTVCPQLAAELGPDSGVCCTEEQLDKLQAQIQMASIFLVGCPACNHNFKHFYCLLTCSPDQAAFSNVTAVQPAVDNNVTSVAEVDYFVSSATSRAFFDSCKDVVYPVANQKAMRFVGGGAATPQEWLDFLGLVKDKRFPPAGSPFQMNFPPEDEVPEGLTALNATIHSCGDAGLACSCGDCPSAAGCEPPPPPPAPTPGGCPALGTSSLSCFDISLLVVYLGLVATIPLLLRRSAEKLSFARGQGDGYEWLHYTPSAALPDREGDDAGNGSHPLPSPSPSWVKGGERDSNVPEELVEYPITEQLLRRWFYHQGVACARRPLLVLAGCQLAVGACALGVVRLGVMTAPEELWVGAWSQAARDKAEYEASFGPFYRITQLILTTTPSAASHYTTPSGLPSIVTDANIRLLFDMQDEIDALSATIPLGDKSQEKVQLDDVCLRPLGGACAHQTVLQYWGMSREVYEKGGPPLFVPPSPEFCFTHWSTQCFSAFGGPVDPHLVLGGFPVNGTSAGSEPQPPLRNFTADSTSFVVTFPLDSHLDKRPAALAWEAAFASLAAGRLSSLAAAANLTLSFSTERSVEDELQRESSADVSTVLFSYLAMLGYIALALGTFPRRQALLASGGGWRELLVHSRAGLGLGGVLMVAASVAGALGLCGWIGVKATLIIMEVIPFLVLAVGVDNMFILAHALADSAEPRAPLPHRVGLALAGVGPSITLAAACETVAFATGALTSMPALRSFSVCAALAVGLDFFLQVTAFVALLALDTERVEGGRYDCLPWRRAPTRPLYDSDYEELPERSSSQFHEIEEDEGATEAAFSPGFAVHAEEHIGISRLLRRYMAEVHAPLLLRPLSKALVLAAFLAMFLLSCALIPRVERGLDQSVALPSDSYLQHYYADVMSVLRVGPPAMLVVRRLNVSEAATDVDAVCSVAGCKTDSLLNQVSAASRAPWSSWLATPAASWLDDFLTWVSPEIPQCCRQFANGTRCPPPDQTPCSQDPSACQECIPCFTGSDLPGGKPSLEQFQAKLPWFLASLPSQACAKGGAGTYTDSVQMDPSDPGGVAGLRLGLVNASAFRTNYVVLAQQSDFVNALQATRDFASHLSSTLGLDVYAYSIWHLFFEQYLTIVGEAIVLLGSAAVAVFLICLVATGSIWASSIILITLGMLLVDLMGVMQLWGIQFNAVSLVNLVMALGIGVEFCAHIIHAFMEEGGTPDQRAAAALSDVGAAVLSGITLTKVVGVSVLAFARTKIFEIYYFRMYLALVVLGAAHGLIFLPVLLATLGPDSYDRWFARKLPARGSEQSTPQAGGGHGRRKSEELVGQPSARSLAAAMEAQQAQQAGAEQVGGHWGGGEMQGAGEGGGLELEGS